MRVTEAFLAGLTEEAGAEVEVIHLSDCRITPCAGCLSCWGRTEGECVIKNDDIPRIKEKILAADLVIESFPLYFFGMPGIVKVFTDRMLSMLCTYRGQAPVKGTSFHGIRAGVEGKKFVVISTCGYAQTDLVYDPLLAQLDIICGPGQYIPVLCPQGKTLRVPELTERIDRFLTKFTDAGRELRRTGALSPETVADLRKPPFPQRTFQRLLDKFWQDEQEGGRHV
jgi:multimeric flavodoxin WrbA